MNNIIVTGASGFIGSNLITRLLKDGTFNTVVGLNHTNTCSGINSLKYDRIANINRCFNSAQWKYYDVDITDQYISKEIFLNFKPNIVVHLAAKTGVRDNLDKSDEYIKTNILGFHNIIELSRICGVKHFIYASSSSVYGENLDNPLSINSSTDNPLNIYAVSKKSNELIAHCYSKLSGLYTTGLRFFSVYGPTDSPNRLFTQAIHKILSKEEFQLYNYGNDERDFIYIDDCVEGIIRTLNRYQNSFDFYKIYNLGSAHSTKILNAINILIEELLTANLLPQDYDFAKYIKLVPSKPTDMSTTCADMKEFKDTFHFIPTIELKTGLRNLVNWYKFYYIDKLKDKTFYPYQ